MVFFFLSRVGIVEESAIRELKERLYANKTALMAAFLERDKENTGTNSLYCFWASPVLSSFLVDFWMTLICFMSSFFTKHQNSLKLATFIFYHVKVLLKRSHLNGHAMGFHPQTRKLEPHTKQIVPCESTAEEDSFEWSHHEISSTDFKVRTTYKTNSTM